MTAISDSTQSTAPNILDGTQCPVCRKPFGPDAKVKIIAVFEGFTIRGHESCIENRGAERLDETVVGVVSNYGRPLTVFASCEVAGLHPVDEPYVSVAGYGLDEGLDLSIEGARALGAVLERAAAYAESHWTAAT